MYYVCPLFNLYSIWGYYPIKKIVVDNIDISLK